MKQMSWEDYYAGFYDWSPSTQRSYAYRLSNFGLAEEVCEVAQELEYHDRAFATRFLEKALDAGVRFSPDQVLEMVGTVDQTVLGRMAEETAVPFGREQLEEIWGLIDEAAFRRISKRAGIDVLDGADHAGPMPRHAVQDLPRKKGDGLISFLLGWLLGSALDDWLHRGDQDGH